MSDEIEKEGEEEFGHHALSDDTEYACRLICVLFIAKDPGNNNVQSLTQQSLHVNAGKLWQMQKY